MGRPKTFTILLKNNVNAGYFAGSNIEGRIIRAQGIAGN